MKLEYDQLNLKSLRNSYARISNFYSVTGSTVYTFLTFDIIYFSEHAYRHIG